MWQRSNSYPVEVCNGEAIVEFVRRSTCTMRKVAGMDRRVSSPPHEPHVPVSTGLNIGTSCLGLYEFTQFPHGLDL